MLKHLITVIIMTVLITACGSTTTEDASTNDSDIIAQDTTEITVTEPTSEPATDAPIIEATTETVEATQAPTSAPTAMPPSAEPTAVTDTSAYNAPEWTSLELVNARTGEMFTLADFAGKTVFIEPMATWCSNCRTQQGNVAQAMSQLDADEFVFISLSVGENISNETLASYADRNDFPQVFAIANDDLTRALIDNFGFSVTTPPSTPHFTISPTGTISSLSTGVKNADSFVQEALAIQQGS